MKGPSLEGPLATFRFYRWRIPLIMKLSVSHSGDQAYNRAKRGAMFLSLRLHFPPLPLLLRSSRTPGLQVVDALRLVELAR